MRDDQGLLTVTTDRLFGNNEKMILTRPSVVFMIALLLISLASAVYAIPPRHNASAITEGTFNSGNYTFPDSLNITNMLEAASIFYVNPITQRVGIGTEIPVFRLEVYGDINTTGLLMNETSCNNGLITNSEGLLICSPTPFHAEMDYTNIAMTNQTNTFTSGHVIDNTSAITGAYLNISDGDSPKLIVDSAGNVGIGTTNPGAKLDVSGSVILGLNNNNTITFNAKSGNDLDMNSYRIEKMKEGMEVRNAAEFNSVSSMTGGIQEAIDDLPAEGGVVYVPPGTFTLKSWINLKSNMILRGAGAGTVLKVADEISSSLTQDAPIGTTQITVTSASGFEVGMLVLVKDDNYISTGNFKTITDIDGNVITLDSGIYGQNLTVAANATVISSVFPIVYANTQTNVIVENIKIDGNNAQINNYFGQGGSQAGILFSGTKDSFIQNNWIVDSNGDGIGVDFVASGAYVRVINNVIQNATIEGIHLGAIISGVTITGNQVTGSGSDGLYFCTAVQNAIVSNNMFALNNDSGIHIDYDTSGGDRYNTFSGNVIKANGEYGFFSQGGSGPSFDNPAYNTLSNNVIVDNSISSPGTYSGIYLLNSHHFTVTGNVVYDDQSPKTQKYGIEETGTYSDYNMYIGNEISGNLVGSIAKVGLYTVFLSQENLSLYGNVGIGIANPTARLEVVNAATAGDLNALHVIQHGTEAWASDIYTDGQYGLRVLSTINTGTSGLVSFQNSNGTIMRVTNAGNVGIGTTGPTQKLNVEGNANITGDVFLPTQSLASCSGKLITDSIGNITCGVDDSGDTSTNPFQNDSTQITPIDNNHNFSYNSGTFFIDPGSNNVGIGTTNPMAKLYIDNADTASDITGLYVLQRDTEAWAGDFFATGQYGLRVVSGMNTGTSALVSFQNYNGTIMRVFCKSSG